MKRLSPSASQTRLFAGATVSLAVALVILSILSFIWMARSDSAAHAIDLDFLLWRSTLQASLSTILSLLAGIALAWALNRLRFPGRTLVIGLLSAALVAPALVVAVGIISVWGRAGWINTLLAGFGWQTGSIFGLWGIVYAHVLLDATFAAAILIARLDALPANRLRLGQNLRLSPLKRFRVIDWPAIAPALPGLAAVIFLLAFTSFPIVLTLGGGPANQTLEVAIYAAVRLDFDLAAAVTLALVQLGLTALLIVPATLFSPVAPGAGTPPARHWPEPLALAALAMLILLAALFAFGLPLVSVLWDGLHLGGLLHQSSFWQASLTSLGVGIASAGLALILAIAMAMARISAHNKWLRLLVAAPSYVYLAVPGVTLSLGFFLGARFAGIANQFAAPFVLVLANALLTLPYGLATLSPALETVHSRYDRLAVTLNLSGWARWRHVEYPLIGREIGLVLAMGFCFSLGDLSVISLFGTESFSTLPWLMNRALGAYRTNDAAAIGAILLIISIATFLLLPRLIERVANARS